MEPIAPVRELDRSTHGRTVAVRLLGRVEADCQGRQVRLPGRQTQALFALLCLDRRPRSREALAADLWPEASTSSFASLRQALWLIRTGLATAGSDPVDVLDVGVDTISIRPCAIDVDVHRFAALARRPGSDPETALALYRGDLVEGIAHDVFARERERLADDYEDVLALAARARLGTGDIEGARELAHALLRRDGLREEAHEILIAVHGATGTRSQVIRQYRHLVDLLRRELDVEPLPETIVAYQAALAHTVARSRERAVLSSADPTRPVLVSAG